MKLTVDARQLTEENKRNVDLLRFSSKELWKIVRAVSFAIEREIKQHGGKFSMPRDTGRAAASWGHWDPGMLRRMTVTTGGGEKLSVTRAEWANNLPGPDDAHWKEDEWDLSVEQGSNVEYVQYLNEGHSSQATAGFLNRAEEHAQKILEKRVDEFIDRYW